MSKRKDRFACFVPVKPYVRRYLLTNYNAPDVNWAEMIDLSSDKELLVAFRSRLRKKGRWENKYKKISRYSEQITIEISHDDFYRYGWSMSNTEAVSFGQIVERRVKTMLFVYLDVRIALGAHLSASIRDFQLKFGFTEQDWPYDTIRREYLRHSYRKGLSEEVGTLNMLIDKIILGKLSKNGTISQQGLKDYENSSI